MSSKPKNPSGFEEKPQPELTGAPLQEAGRAAGTPGNENFEGGAMDEWLKQVEEQTAREQRDEETRKLRSDAGKHRAKVAREARKKAERESGVSEKRSSRGGFIGGSSDPKERAATGLNPISGLEISLEEANSIGNSGVTATVDALSKLISEGNPLIKNGEEWIPHRPDRPVKSEGGVEVKMVTEFKPSGDQPTAIKDLIEGLAPAPVAAESLASSQTATASTDAKLDSFAEQQTNPNNTQVLLGVTGSGKTFTMAKVIEATQRPALILAPNKTLAAQLYGEMKQFFPENAVEYFVSYYDYYQPEAYVPRSDTYIEKESSVNEQIDRMRHSATRSLLERDDVVIVASVSCIYGIGSVETYTAMTFEMKIGDQLDQRALLADLVAQQYKRNDAAFTRGTFRVRGDTIEIFPAHLEDSAWRISLFGNEIETITEFDPLTGQKTGELKSVKIYANSHYVTPRPTLNQAMKAIKEELKHRLAELNDAGRLLEAQRLEQRTRFDLEMMEATGACAGIENYSRYLTGRKPGEPPPTLFEYIPDNALVFVDESHVTIPQIGGMYRGDFRRKATLAEYGFRLPSCMDNRPLRFEEWDRMRPQTICVSATPGGWEMEAADGVFAEQVIRPTGLIDPPVEIRPARTQVDDVLDEILQTAKAGYRTLVTTLTKRMAEDLTEYLHEAGVRVRYMHSDIDTLERIEIIRDLRLGAFDCLIGINLLREGLDIPECALVAILDADKEGFLRSETSLVQTIGRAARNIDGRVILYADKVTGSMERAIAETDRRREKQEEYNTANGITPESIKSNIGDILSSVYEQDRVQIDTGFAEEGALVGNNLKVHLQALEKEMRDAAADLDFETAARLRDEIKRLQEIELSVADDPLARDVGIENTQKSRKRKAQGKPEKKKNSPHPEPVEGRGASGNEGGHPVLRQAQDEGGSGSSLFRKNTLDEMTVGRTEKPLGTPPPVAAQTSATSRSAGARTDGDPDGSAENKQSWSEPRKSYGEEMRNDRGTNSAYGTPLSPEDKATARGKESASVAAEGSATSRTATASTGGDPAGSARPIKRGKIGLGSYEDKPDQKRRGRPKKTGKPGM